MIHGLLDQLQPDASDEEDDDTPDVEFEFREGEASEAKSSMTPGKCRTLVVCGPGAATAFALGAFSLQPVPWRLDFARGKGPARAFPPPPRPPRFHVPSGGGATAVAILDGPLPEDLATAWAEALLAGFPEAEEVLYLDRVFRAGWRAACGEERPLEPHLCGLWTAAWGAAGPPGAPAALPAPNIVQGLAAALLTQCEASGRRCLAALALQDGAHLTEGCVRAFTSLGPSLQASGLISDSDRPKYNEAVKQVVSPLSMSIYA